MIYTLFLHLLLPLIRVERQTSRLHASGTHTLCFTCHCQGKHFACSSTKKLQVFYMVCTHAIKLPGYKLKLGLGSGSRQSREPGRLYMYTQVSILSVIISYSIAKLTTDLVLWSPNTSDAKIREYLSSINDILQIKEGLPGSTDDRDNEQALHILCSNDYKVGQSLQQFREKMVSHQSKWVFYVRIVSIMLIFYVHGRHKTLDRG